ncbi:hypothetical protein Hypma_012505 [Hypsizygus marmoreus]|uniref:Uncharacterized protein n=1 Tax=Hypsizygus marmoreus TaxID=39966 RepID=A0A369JIH9_HYPMA|nr:hypothetical protein Hypma_012505 [Hypsizygus marmoreus]
MTQSIPPTGTSGNITPIINQNQTGIPGIPQRPVSPSGNEDNVDQILTRNIFRQLRRDSGEENVSDDEETTSRQNSPNPEPPKASEGPLLQFLSAYSLLTATECHQVDTVILASGPSPKQARTPAVATGPLFSAALEQPALSNSGAHKFSVHPLVRDLAIY